MVLSTLDDVFCTWWCFLHLMVFSTLDSVFYTWWCFPHLMVFSTLDGVFCTWWFFYTWWCFLHLLVFSTLDVSTLGVFCTWCFLHLMVFSALGVFCTWGSSHTRRLSVSFCAAHQRQYKILLLHLVCGVCATQQLVLIFVVSCQKHSQRGIEQILFSTPDAWYWPTKASAGGTTQASYQNIKTRRSQWGG